MQKTISVFRELDHRNGRKIFFQFALTLKRTFQEMSSEGFAELLCDDTERYNKIEKTKNQKNHTATEMATWKWGG